mmetsp:Transcript_69678/g.192868  ORF Transcript_69678/g.192868 Transcript_69678/m.192868 type:complete len:90 (+) Transcript_69678:634-903(+)
MSRRFWNWMKIWSVLLRFLMRHRKKLGVCPSRIHLLTTFYKFKYHTSNLVSGLLGLGAKWEIIYRSRLSSILNSVPSRLLTCKRNKLAC